MVSNYGLHIEYEHTIGDRYIAYLYMKNDKMSNSDYIIFRLCFWVFFIPFLMWMAIVNYRMKLLRQEREDTMFYKIYRNLLEVDPEFENNKNEI